MQIPAGKKIYFLSDFHLGVPDHASSLQREKLVVRFLDEAKKDAAVIFIVGDLFDFWYEYKKAGLKDWAAPAIQYCRALEYEVRRRIYHHRPMPEKHQPANPAMFRVSGAGWTLGTLKRLYQLQGVLKGDDAHNWKILQEILKQARCNNNEFLSILQRLQNEHIVEYRNQLAHGEPVEQRIAENLRDSILGTSDKAGILSWLAQKLPPV